MVTLSCGHKKTGGHRLTGLDHLQTGLFFNTHGYMQAFVEYGIRHNSLGEEFKAWLKESVGIKK